MYKMNLEHLVPQKKKSAQKNHSDGLCQKTEEPLGGAPSDQSRDDLNEKLNSIGL